MWMREMVVFVGEGGEKINPFPVRCPANQLLFRPTQKQDFRPNTIPARIFITPNVLSYTRLLVLFTNYFANSNPDPNHQVLFLGTFTGVLNFLYKNVC